MNNTKTKDTIFSIRKNINVFSEKDFKKSYEQVMRKIFGISPLAFKIYQYAQQKDKDEEDLILLDRKEMARDFAATQERVKAAMDELAASGLLVQSLEKNMFCLENNEGFDMEKYDNIQFVINISRKKTIDEGEANIRKRENDKQQASQKRLQGIHQYLRENFSFNARELSEMDTSLHSRQLTKEKFLKKMDKWLKGMPANITTNQKKNYISACIVNEEWQ